MVVYLIFFEGCGGIQCLGKPLDGSFRSERKAWNPDNWDQWGQLGERLWVLETVLCPFPFSPCLQVSQLENIVMLPSACSLGTLLWTNSVDIIWLSKLSAGKESTCNAGDVSSIPGLGRSPGEGNDNPLQNSCLGNPMDREAWQATIHGSRRVRYEWAYKYKKIFLNLFSPFLIKEIQPVHPKGDQSWVFIGRTDAEAETPALWPPHAKSWLIGKDPNAGRDWGQKKGTTEDEMAGWHHWLDGHESE